MKPITVFVPLPPSYRGGTEEYAYRVAATLAEEWPVRIVTTTVRWAPGSAMLPTGRASVEFLPAREIFQRPLVVGRTVRRRIRALVEGSSLVHLHMPFPSVERWVTRAGRVAGVPTVMTYHMDADFAAATGKPFLGGITALYRALSARPALSLATGVVSNSQGYADTSPLLRPYLGKVVVIRKGLDQGRFGLSVVTSNSPPPSRDGWAGVEPPAKRLLFVGRLVRYKGVANLIEAVRRLRGQGVDVHLRIAGRGPELPALMRRVMHLGLSDVVQFLGFVADAELGSLYRGADVTVCPSLSRLESTPTSLEESAALGTPIVGSSLPGADESLPNDGVRGRLVPPGDVDALVQAVREMTLVARPPVPTNVRSWAETAAAYRTLMAKLLPPISGPAASTPN